MATTQTARMWNSADYYVMMGILQSAGMAPGNPRTAVELTTGLLLVWMLHRVPGKKIVESAAKRYHG